MANRKKNSNTTYKIITVSLAIVIILAMVLSMIRF